MPPKRKFGDASEGADDGVLQASHPRKRRTSESTCSAAASLTETNLDLLQNEFPPSPLPAQAAATSSSGRSSYNGEADRIRLQTANIFYDTGTAIPYPLRQHVESLKRARIAPSPNFREIADQARDARQGNEIDARIRFASTLLLRKGSEGGHHWVNRLEDARLNHDFMPPVVDEVAKVSKVTIPQAQPDTCIGYIPPSLSMARASKPFTALQENVINLRMSLHMKVFFPFFTAQWEPNHPHIQAIAQGARDGAVIVNHLRSLFRAARGAGADEPGLLETCHFSMTFDGRLAILWVHWFDAQSGHYHMESFDSVAVDVADQNVGLRAFLRNLQDFAVIERLDNIRHALDRLRASIIGAEPEPDPDPMPASAAAPKRPVKKAKTSTKIGAPEPTQGLRRSERRKPAATG